MRRPVLAVSSGGGHWVQLLRATADIDRGKVIFATTDGGVDLPMGAHLRLLPDANKKTYFRLLVLVATVVRLIATVRPAVVISTGAAPGALCIMAGKLLGARTMWIDSLANTQQLSLSGRLVAAFCDVRLSQWPRVAESANCEYRGSVL